MPALDEKALNIEIGQRIKALRNQAGLSQDDLAVRLNLLRTSITNIESGRQKLTLASLYKLSLAFNISFGEILPPIEMFLDKDPLEKFDTDDLLNRSKEVIDKYLWSE